MADPDLELGGGGGVLINLPCWPFSFLSFLLFTQNKERPPLEPPLAGRGLQAEVSGFAGLQIDSDVVIFARTTGTK